MTPNQDNVLILSPGMSLFDDILSVENSFFLSTALIALSLWSRPRIRDYSIFHCIQRALIAFYGPLGPIRKEMGLDTVCIGRPLIGAYDVDIAYFRKRFSVE
jgi:hypothetical protein